MLMSMYLEELNDFGKLPNTVRYYIDSPSTSFFMENDGTFIFCGWFLSLDENISINYLILKRLEAETKIYFDQKRPDVLYAFFGEDIGGANEACGFKVTLDKPKEPFQISICINEVEMDLFRIHLFQAEKVLVGKEDWLYLDNDSNHSVEQYCGKIAIDKALIGWDKFFSRENISYIDKRCSTCFLIAPSKEYIVNNFYPYERGGESIAEIISERYKSIIYPIEELVFHKELSFWKNDTHWTDFAVSLVCRRILEAFNISLDFYEEYISKKKYKLFFDVGDLGGKIANGKAAPVFRMDLEIEKENIVFDNNIVNFGHILILQNNDARLNATCIVFGGSSAKDTLIYILSMQFSRVVFVHTAGRIDKAIIEHEDPAYIVQQTNQRFLLSPEDFFIDVNYYISEKLKGSSLNNFFPSSFQKNKFYIDMLGLN
ncbi:hypothetical protein ACI2KR_28610 [Pseudomonas luteola]